ncbi:MAG: hypothetical protein AUF64_00345 [Chloroflexi bacterium 13_1_20CM_54_36]|nr:MAG: hypothetical protein AUF64_00345 [Chloroflexi bacterium 13_1_20CM_54_36]
MTKVTVQQQEIPQFANGFKIIFIAEEKLYCAMNGMKSMTIVPGKMAEFKKLDKAIAYMASRNIHPIEA